MSSSSFLSLVSWNGYAAGSLTRARLYPKAHNLVFGGRRIHSSSIRVSNVRSSCGSDNNPPAIRTSSPWLMLPPTFGGGDMIYNFYSLADKQVQSFNKSKTSGNNCKPEKDDDGDDMPDHDALFVGSSHGWLIFFNRSDKKMFLSDPITRRHVELPPIDTLAIPEYNYKSGHRCVENVILSGSDPDDDDCRAMMRFAPLNKLAFCCPGHSIEWTPIGDVYFWDDDDDSRVARCYQSFVYSTKQKLFFTVDDYDEFEAWDLSDPRSPRRIAMDDVEVEDGKSLLASKPYWTDREWQISYQQFLVIAEHTDELFLVRRFFMQRMGPDGLHVEYIYYGPMTGFSKDHVPDRTIGFDVHKYDPVERVFKYVDTGSDGAHEYDPEIKAFKYANGIAGSGSLDGLAFFVGINHGFALRADLYPELKPNSIYFTDTKAPPDWDDDPTGGDDLGIFNYDDGTFSECYYPRDYASIKRMNPAPMWFTPSPGPAL